MVATTGTWALPYQQGTDRGCDYDDVWCAFVDRVDDIMGQAQDIVSLGRALPAAKVYNDTTLTPKWLPFNNQPFIRTPQYMALEMLDTNNMVNLDTVPDAINPTRNGRYIVLAYEELQSAGGFWCEGGFAGALKGEWIATDTDVTQPGGNDPTFSYSGGFQWSPRAAGIGIIFEQTSGFDNQQILIRAEFTCFWIGDL